MKYREATINDISQIMEVRFAVKENRLSNPEAVKAEDCVAFLTHRGKGWVCEVDDKIVGFSIVGMQERNVWALFLLPDYEGQGIGKQLHQLMLDWYFSQTKEPIWLSTDTGTRAEQFYQKLGWQRAGMNGSEVRFEMSFESWVNK